MTDQQIDRMTSGACIAWNGQRCKSNEFGSRKKYTESKHKPSAATIGRIKNLPVVDIARIDEIENPDVHEWYQIGDDKYGRTMYCHKTGIRRGQTMGEFYGNSTVD